MFPHTNKMVFYWQRSHHEVVSMVTDAWAVCQTVRRSLVTAREKCIIRPSADRRTCSCYWFIRGFSMNGKCCCRRPEFLVLAPACWFSPRLGPSHLHARTPLPLHLQMCVNAEAREQTDGGDGVDLAISWEAGQEPESPLARAQGSMRTALWISQVSLLHWPQRAATIPRQTLWCSDEVTRPVHILGLVQSRHSQFEPKLDILQIKQHHLVRL